MILRLDRASFMCLSKACAPPPVGKGGSTAMSRAAASAARTLGKKVNEIESHTTSLVKGVVDGAGGTMVGLKFRKKTIGSLARKIHNKAIERNQSVEESAGRISDALRYTGVFPTKGYAAGIRGTLQAMMKKGYTVEVNGKKLKQKFTLDELETHWRKGDAYNGVHAIMRHPNGTKVEMQFHTPGSFKAKMRTHGMYEEFRKLSTTPERRKQLIEEMVKIADSVPTPEDALSFGEQVFRPADGG